MTEFWNIAGALGVTTVVVGVIACFIGLLSWMGRVEDKLKRIEKHTRKARKP